MRSGAWFLIVMFIVGQSLSASADVVECDVCVYGGTSAGVIAAVQAARMGKRAVVIEPGRRLGGLTAGGLGQTDSGNKSAIGGLSREFYRRLGKHYGVAESWTFEPHAAEAMFRAMLDEAKVPVRIDHRLASVAKDGARIVEILLDDGTACRAKVYLDATYEGDLMAGAKVSYAVGREPNATYGETLNGVRAETPKHQFTVPVDPYVREGDPASGLLPRILAGPFGEPGAGDRSVQAYNLRLCLTNVTENRIPFPKPDGYDPGQYALLARYIREREKAGQPWQDMTLVARMPDGKTDTNNNGAFSTDDIGMNYDYPDGDAATRERIYREHLAYTQGLMYFLTRDPGIPERIRNEIGAWGLCRDEFVDNGGWSHQLYIREARRMISAFVMTQVDCEGRRTAEDPVGLASYTMDSHNCRRIVRNGRVENEGDVQVRVPHPFPVSYRSIVPREGACVNLLVPVCLSASHIAYGSIRMEPVFMVLGQSAATAACQAIDAGAPVQRVGFAGLRERLIADGQIIE